MPEPEFDGMSAPETETPATLERRRRSRGHAVGDLRRFSMVGTTTAKVVPLHRDSGEQALAQPSPDDVSLRETLRAKRLERARRDFDFEDVEDVHRSDLDTLLDAYERCLHAGMDTDDLNDYLHRAYYRWDDGLPVYEAPDARG